MRLADADRVGSQPLAEDYRTGQRVMNERFDYSPWREEDWSARVDWLDAHSSLRADRTALAKALRLYNEEIGNEGALTRLEQLKQEKTVVVVGGQQAGLFTGPLLVVHKAISIIRLAREAEERLGRPVVPVFWIAGEDHDFDEVNHWYALQGETVERYRLPHPLNLRTSISRLAIPSWAEALEQMDQWLTPSDFKAELMERLSHYAEQSRSLTDYFARIMGWLFGQYGLVLMDSDDVRLRRLEAPCFEQQLLRNRELHDCYLQGLEAVRALGYAPQAEQAEGSVNLFIYNNAGERVLLYRNGDGYADRKRTLELEENDLRSWLQTEPERFSNNVMTRPLMQDYLLPVLAAVLGPGEIAYWALTREAFHAIGFKMPIVAPRLEFTLVEGAVQKNMEKYGLTYSVVMEQFEAFRAEWLAGQGGTALEGKFEEVKASFLVMYEPLLSEAAALNPGLGKLADTNRQKLVEQIDFMKAKASDALQSRHATGLRQLERIRLSLAPLSKPQERVYNVFAYLNKYGSRWVEELIHEPCPYDGKHRLVYL